MSSIDAETFVARAESGNSRPHYNQGEIEGVSQAEPPFQCKSPEVHGISNDFLQPRGEYGMGRHPVEGWPSRNQWYRPRPSPPAESIRIVPQHFQLCLQ